MHHLTKVINPHHLFWFGLFIPVSVLFQALCFSLEALPLDLESPASTIVFVKFAYFTMVFLGIVSLQVVWRTVTDRLSLPVVWAYRLLGLASVTALLVIHAQTVYQFGQVEREIRRTMVTTNQAYPLAPMAGVRIDRVRLESRAWIQELTMTDVQASLINREKFVAAIRPMLRGTVCAEPWNRYLFGHRVKVRYVIYDRDGEVLTDELFGEDTCSIGQ